MIDINKFYEVFLEELQLDVDFNSTTRQFIVKTLDATYSESVELTSMSQLLNAKSDEFMRAILLDVDAKFVISFDKYDLYAREDSEHEAPSYELNVDLNTKVELVDINLVDMVFDDLTINIGLDQLTAVEHFCEKHNYNRVNSNLSDLYQPTYIKYELKVQTTDELETAYKNVIELLKSFTVTKDELIKKFSKFKR